MVSDRYAQYADRNAALRRMVLVDGLSYTDAAIAWGHETTRNTVAGVVHRTSRGERKRLAAMRPS